MGICASVCVKETAEGTLQNGFKIATSGKLIVDPRDTIDDKSKDWYEEHGEYHEDLYPNDSLETFPP